VILQFDSSMKLTSFLYALCVLCGSSPAAETRDLILIAGQSNAVGYDAKPSELPVDAADKQVMFWFRAGDPPPDEFDTTSGGKWLPGLQPQPKGTPMEKGKAARQYGNFSGAAGGFGPEMGLARALVAKEKKPLAIVKAAWSGTGMAQDWNPADAGPGGSCYRALVSETKAAIAAAKAQGITLRPRALAWVQGESDANATAAPRYTQALGDMIAALRKDLDAPQLIALVAVNTQFGGGKNAFMPKIVEAQQALAAKDPRCAYVDTATASIANSAHFDTSGTIDVGRRFADALVKTEGKLATAPAK
jgi:Carbohydrate esterase, sialic acid-specific acetylesterase